MDIEKVKKISNALDRACEWILNNSYKCPSKDKSDACSCQLSHVGQTDVCKQCFRTVFLEGGVTK